MDLGHLFVSLLDVIFCREDGSYSMEAYDIVIGWFGKMLDRALIG